MARHFICYSQLDAYDFAIWLRNELEGGHPPIHVWRDQDDVPPGEHWMETTDDAIRGCLSLLFVITRDSVRHESECTDEWDQARRLHKPILPLQLHADADPPPRLRTYQHIKFAGDHRQGLAQLRKRLQQLESPEGELRWLNKQLPELLRDLKAGDLARRKHAEQIVDDVQRRIAMLARTVRPAGEDDEGGDSASALDQPPRPVAVRRSIAVIGRVPDPGPDLFQDRVETTQLLESYLRDDRVRLVVVVGRHGIGKSSMVGRLLGQLCDDANPDPPPPHFNGIVYLSTDGEPAFSTTTLLENLRDVLPTAAARPLDGWFGNPEGTSREKLYHLLWAFAEADMHVVLVVDGLETLVHRRTQSITDSDLDRVLRTLLDPAFPQRRLKVVLVTTAPPRSLMTTKADWQQWLHLDEGLPSPYAENLLRQLDPRDELGLQTATDEQLDRARRHTGGHPEALRALTVVLRLRGTSLQELLEDTAALKDVNRALVGEAFDSLDPEAQRTMQALAVLKRPVSSEAIDHLLEPWIPAPRSAETLDRLHGMHLVRKVEKANRYVLPTEFRAYVLDLVRPGWEENDSSFSQLTLLRRGADFFAQERERAENCRSLEDLTPHLMEIDLRYRAGEYDLATWLLLQIDSRYLLTWGHSQLVLEQHQVLEGRISDPGLKEASLGTIGTAYFRLGQEELAADYYRRARNAARVNRDMVSEKRWLNNLGSTYFEMGQTSRARQCYERALEMARKSGEREEEAKPLVGLSLCLGEVGEFEAAIEHHLETLVIARESGDRRIEAEQLANAGYFYALLDQSQQANEHLKQGLVIARDAGYRFVEGHCLVDSADLLVHQEQVPLAERLHKAIGLARQAAGIGQQAGSPQLNWSSSSILALAHLRNGTLTEARIAIDTACQYDRRRRMHATFALRGIVAVRRGDYRAAGHALATARGLAEGALSRRDRNYTAFDAKGLALSGLVISGLYLDAEQRPEALLKQAGRAYSRARAITRAPGVVTRVLCLLDELAKDNDQWDLSQVRDAAAGIAA